MSDDKQLLSLISIVNNLLVNNQTIFYKYCIVRLCCQKYIQKDIN